MLSAFLGLGAVLTSNELLVFLALVALGFSLACGTIWFQLAAAERRTGSLEETSVRSAEPSPVIARSMRGVLALTLPAVVVGFTLKDRIEEAATSVTAAGCGLFVTAAFLLIGERSRRRHEASHPAEPPVSGSAPTLRWGDAIAMGLAQAAAIWPGVSRSGSTISTGLVRGLPAAEAARLSFLMSLPAISGAAILELPGALDEGFGGLSPGIVLAAAAVAGLVGWAALTTLLLVLRRGSFPYFAAYCALLGTLALTVLR